MDDILEGIQDTVNDATRGMTASEIIDFADGIGEIADGLHVLADAVESEQGGE